MKKENKKSQQEDTKKKQENSNTLLDHYIQRKMTTQLDKVDEKAIAMAIKTLLQEDKDTTTLH